MELLLEAYVDEEKSFLFQLYAKDAEIIWTKMLDFNCKEVGMTHDGYLKVYQLSKPKLYNYDCILIDEAQDMSPGILITLVKCINNFLIFKHLNLEKIIKKCKQIF